MGERHFLNLFLTKGVRSLNVLNLLPLSSLFIFITYLFMILMSAMPVQPLQKKIMIMVCVAVLCVVLASTIGSYFTL